MTTSINRKTSILRDEEGAVAVIAAIAMIALLAMAALVVDFGYGVSTRTEIQEVADATALAAAGNLNGTLAGINNAGIEAQTFAGLNSAVGEAGDISLGSVEFGTWIQPNTFIPIGPLDLGYPNAVDAVRVSTRRDIASGTQLSTFFGGAIGRDSMETRAEAVAQVVGAACSGTDCGIELPIVICDNMLNGAGGFCAVQVETEPTPTQDGGITSFFNQPGSVPVIRNFITNPSTVPDVTTVHAPPPSSCYSPNNTMDPPNTVEMNEGSLSPIFAEMWTKWNEHVEPCRLNGSGPNCMDQDGDGRWEWKTVVAIAWCNGGPVPQGACIRGFSNFYVEEVCYPGKDDEHSTPDFQCSRAGGEADNGVRGIYGFAECDGNGNGGSIAETLGVAPIAGLV
ncbi:MAG TPA: pilus assembly protein TadG-related protein, partial [Nitrospiria bacterium]